MNQTQSYMDVHGSHVSTPQPYGSLPASGGGNHSLRDYQQAMMHNSYPSTPSSYPTYSYPNGVISPQSNPQHGGSGMPPGMQSSMLPQLPAMTAGAGTPHGYGPTPTYAQQQAPQQPYDTSGQVAPPGMKPRVTATLWEDEGSLCFQVEAKGVCVARREDNHFINGTKLLNVAGMTRGRRDGILKSEKVRNVVKIGPMHLKGVWIPFERALEFANREKITDLLYPLFVHNIGGLLYEPQNANRTNAVVRAADSRRIDNAPPRPPHMSQPPALQHHNTMANPIGASVSQSQHSIAPHPAAGRPGLDRAHTFPTPPTSASSVLGVNGSSGSSYNDWNGQSLTGPVPNSQPLTIDTGLSNAARSMPTTPATTPPGNTMQNMHSYQGQQGYDNTKQYYSGPPSQPSYPSQQAMTRYGQSTPGYVKSEMGPPSARATGIGHEADQQDYKNDPYNQRPASSHIPHHSGDGEAEQDHEQDYMNNTNGAYATSRGSYGYANGSSVPNIQPDHSHISPEMNGSPSQHNGSGRVTPRTANAPQPAWANGYHTPPRQSQSSTVYNIMSDSRVTGPDGTSNGYTTNNYTTSTMGGTPSNKRGRDDDDQDHGGRPASSGLEPAFDLKRQRTMRENSINSGVGAMPAMPSGIKAGGVQRRR